MGGKIWDEGGGKIEGIEGKGNGGEVDLKGEVEGRCKWLK